MTPNQVNLRAGLSSPREVPGPAKTAQGLESLDDLLDNIVEMSGSLQAAYTRQIDCGKIVEQVHNLFDTVTFNVNYLRDKIDRVEVARTRLAELTDVVMGARTR